MSLMYTTPQIYRNDFRKLFLIAADFQIHTIISGGLHALETPRRAYARMAFPSEILERTPKIKSLNYSQRTISEEHQKNADIFGQKKEPLK
jgi:hypothetical protein